MEALQFPERGEWFRGAAGELFKVVSVDEEEGLIEVQHFDGAIEEIDADTWSELAPAPRAAPKDWSGPFDDLEADDFGDTEQPHHPRLHTDPLDLID